MNYLLDTHILIWMMDDSKNLSNKAREIVSNEKNTLYYSVASLWEIAIKKRAKGDKFNYTAVKFLHDCEQCKIHRLPIRDHNVLAYENLPDIHSDPFDCMLVAQAKSEGMFLMTHDRKLEAFGREVMIV